MCVIWNSNEADPGDRYLCQPGQCETCDETRAHFVPVDQEPMMDYFRNYTIYFRATDGRVAFRTWWTQIGVRCHQPPEADEYWVLDSAIENKERLTTAAWVGAQPVKINQQGG